MFFKGFGNDELEALFSVNRYFEFVIMFVLPFGFVFELPLVITILGKLGFITSKFLKKKTAQRPSPSKTAGQHSKATKPTPSPNSRPNPTTC